MNFPITYLLFVNLHHELQSILPTTIISPIQLETSPNQPDDTKRTAVSMCVSTFGFADRGGIERYRALVQHAISEQHKFHPTLSRTEPRLQWEHKSEQYVMTYYISVYYPNSELATLAWLYGPDNYEPNNVIEHIGHHIKQFVRLNYHAISYISVILILLSMLLVLVALSNKYRRYILTQTNVV